LIFFFSASFGGRDADVVTVITGLAVYGEPGATIEKKPRRRKPNAGRAESAVILTESAP
jgi:hypothetical protein